MQHASFLQNLVIQRAIERRRQAEALDPVLLARRCGIEPDPWQAELLRCDDRQVLLNCSRQAGKSTITAILALWRALYTPGALVLLIAPSLRQSLEIFRKFRESMANLPGEADQVEQESGLRVEFGNGSRIVALPGNNEATVRGFSAVDTLIIDEAARVRDDLIIAVRPMLAVSGGRIVALSSPWGKSGWFYSAWADGGPSWKRIHITAEQCPRISREFLEQEKAQMGAMWFDSEYMGVFADSIDSVFRTEDIREALTTEADDKGVSWWNGGR